MGQGSFRNLSVAACALSSRATIGLLISIPMTLVLPIAHQFYTVSRAKKVKCVKQPERAACDTCLDIDKPCTFYDRDHYYAERNKAVASHIIPGSLVASDQSCPMASDGHVTSLGLPGAMMGVLK